MKRATEQRRKSVTDGMVQVGVYMPPEKRERIDAERRSERRSSFSEMCNVLMDEALEAREAAAKA